MANSKDTYIINLFLIQDQIFTRKNVSLQKQQHCQNAVFTNYS